MASRTRRETSGANTLLALALTIPAMALTGFVASKLWAWFLVPLGLPHISYWHAYGLVILVSLLSQSGSRADAEHYKGDTALEILARSVVVDLFALGIGAAVAALAF